MTIPLLDLAIQHQEIRIDMDRAIDEIIATSAFVQGPQVRQFELQFAHYLDVRHVIGVANGTDALHLTLRACGIGPGDEVITAANTFIATTEAISAVGATIRLVDVDPVSHLIDPALVEAAITPRTRAIMPVHLYGQPANMDAIMGIAERFHLLVIEDACQAHGARYRGKRAGTIGLAGCFSFYPGKNLGALGDAGAIVTNDDALAERIRLLANHGSHIKYHHEIEGWNSRLDTLQAAVLGIKLAHLERWNADRMRIAQRYAVLLQGSGVSTPVMVNEDHAWHLYVIESPMRDHLHDELLQRGIVTAIHYPIPLHLQPAYRHLPYEPGSFPVTERSSTQILSLPMYPGLTNYQIEQITAAIWEVTSSAIAA